MEEFNSMSKSDQIDSLCAVHECNEKKRKIHRKQYVDDRWNPHPPMRFVFWWNQGGATYTEKATARPWVGIDSVVAFNCEAVREAYREAKAVGLVKSPSGNYEPIAREAIGT